MVFGARLIVALFVSFILITQYQNCSSYSDSTMFENNNLSSSSVDPSKVNFSVKNIQSDLYVAGYDDHIQIGGSCNPGTYADNYFEYRLRPQNAGDVVINRNGTTQADRLRLADARCENGKFFLVLPVFCPKDGGPNISATTSAFVNIVLHVFNQRDTSGQIVDDKTVTQSIFVDLAPQQGCP
jgi:hypothetical protein